MAANSTKASHEALRSSDVHPAWLAQNKKNPSY